MQSLQNKLQDYRRSSPDLKPTAGGSPPELDSTSTNQV